MKQEERRIPYQGKDYIWTGAEWYEAGAHLTPPAGIIHDLNALIEDDQSTEDSLLNRAPQLLAAACQARDAGQYRCAEELLRRAQFMEPGNLAAGHLAALAVLSSVYRASGHPAQAVVATDAYRDANHPAQLTTPAAALRDLGRWEEAKRTVGHSLRIQESDEAFSVVRRIKAARPDLYD